MKIQGRYTCLVELSINIDGNTKGLLPFEEIYENITGDELTNVIRKIISHEIVDDQTTLTVTKLYGDVYKVEEDLC